MSEENEYDEKTLELEIQKSQLEGNVAKEKLRVIQVKRELAKTYSNLKHHKAKLAEFMAKLEPAKPSNSVKGE